MRALQLFVFVSEVHRMGLNYYPLIKERNLLSPLFRVVLQSPYDFVSAAGAQFMKAVLEDEQRLPKLRDLPELFQMAIDIITSPSPSLLRLEGVLLILRIFVRSSRKSSLIEILSSQYDSIFVGFQRHIEGNHSFVVLNYFLFLVDCATLFPDWNPFVLRTIAETQFSSLLVHVLTHSTNRTVLSDGCIAFHLICEGLNDQRPPSPLIDTLASGFLVVNTMRADEQTRLVGEIETIRSQMSRKVSKLEEDKSTL
jgi:hypothetical protein